MPSRLMTFVTDFIIDFITDFYLEKSVMDFITDHDHGKIYAKETKETKSL